MNFRNAKVLIRLAVNEAGTIDALEIDAQGYLSYFWKDVCFNGPVVAKRFGLIHCLAVKVLDPDGKAFDPDQYERRYNFYVAVLQKVDSLPKQNDLSQNNADFWTDPADSSHWIRYYRKMQYSDRKSSNDDWKDDVYRCDLLPTGTFRIAFAATPPQDSQLPGGILLSEPITLNDEHRERQITQKMVRGGLLRIRAVDADSGDSVVGAGQVYEKRRRKSIGRLKPGFYWKRLILTSRESD